MFFYKVPAFLLYYSLGEIFSVFSYMMAFALLESAVVTLLLVGSAFVLPSKLLKEGFAYKGTLAVLIAAILSIWFQNNLTNDYPSSNWLLASCGIALAVFVLLAFVFHKVAVLQRGAIDVAGRFGLMAYIYVPLGLIGILVFVVRSLIRAFV